MRSKSRANDVSRGFGHYAHLTLSAAPPILAAKLEAGFPHIRFDVPVQIVEANGYSLCRFNVAMTRFLRRGEKSGFPESLANGRYYDAHQIPIARTDSEKVGLLRANFSKGTMIEVLVPDRLVLPDETVVVCFSSQDGDVARSILSRLRSPWAVIVEDAPVEYSPKADYMAAVTTYLERAVENDRWRGNGLEFDRV